MLTDDDLEKALVAYNKAWEAVEGVTAHNVAEVRRNAMREALEAVLCNSSGSDFAGLIDDHNDIARTIAIVKAAYDWSLTIDGTLCGLVAGDMGWASTHIKINMEEIKDSNEDV